jgi:hypothetical protein
VSWHADRDLIERYAAGALPDAAAWSLETHVTSCEPCRLALASSEGVVDDDRLTAIWSDVDGRVRAVQRPLVERVLVRCGVPDHDARLLVATPSLTRSWLLGVAVVLSLAVAGAWLAPAGPGQVPLTFLLLAPLLPLAGVALSFGPGVDPAYDLGVVAPMASSRLLLVRATAVLVTSLLLAGMGTLALPVLAWSAAAWIVPALALTAAALAASTRWRPLPSAALISVVWVTVVVVAEVVGTVPRAAFQPAGQVAAALLLGGSLAVLARRIDRFDTAVSP